MIRGEVVADSRNVLLQIRCQRSLIEVEDLIGVNTHMVSEWIKPVFGTLK